MPETAIAEEILNLTRDFPPVSTEAWEAAIAKDLKGADYEKKLVWRTEEGLGVRPYYRKEALAGLDAQLQTMPGHYPFVRGTGRGWEIAQNAKPGPAADPRRPPPRSRGTCHSGVGLRAGGRRRTPDRADRDPAGGYHRSADRVCVRGWPQLLHRDRQTARRAHSVGDGGERLPPRRRWRLPHAPPRAHAAAQQEHVRPLQQPSARHHRSRLRRNRRLRPAQSRALRVRCAPRAQRAAHPPGRGPSRRRRRPGGRFLLHRSVDRFAGARSLEALPGNRSGRRLCESARLRFDRPGACRKPAPRATKPTPPAAAPSSASTTIPTSPRRRRKPNSPRPIPPFPCPRSASPNPSNRSAAAPPNTHAPPAATPRFCCSSAATSR